MKTLGIIIPLYNEEETIDEMINNVQEMQSGEYKKFIYLINDASIDETKKKITNLKKSYANIKLINNDINLGQNEGLKKSIQYIEKHDIYLTLDGDNQHPTNNIHKYIKKFIEENLDFYHGRKIQEDGKESILRRTASIIATIILRIIYINKDIESTNFFIFNNKTKKIISKLKTKNSLSVEILNKHKYLNIMFFKYVVNNRLRGESKYSFNKRLKLFIGLISDRFKI